MMQKLIQRLSDTPMQCSSQGSKITSTPRNLSPVLTVSPSVSTIAPDVDSDDDIYDPSRSSSDDSEAEQGIASAEGVRKKGLKWVGVWAPLTPNRPKSLYYILFEQCDDIEVVTVQLINDFQTCPKSTILPILQLFVDLCGYKKVKLEKHYNFETQNFVAVINKLETEFFEKDFIERGKFIFMKHSVFACSVIGIVSKFIKKLIYHAFKSNIFLNERFQEHIFKFLQRMSFSTMTNIRVTGVIIVIKFLSALVRLYKECIKDGDENKPIVKNMIEFLYIIFKGNCLIPDTTCYMIKIECTKDMLKWMKQIPELFIQKRKCLTLLFKLILDYNAKVREAALKSCGGLIDSDAVQETLREKLALFVTNVSSRLVDVNVKVAVNAVTTLTKTLIRYPKCVNRSQRLAILYRMIEKDAVLADAAGKFLATYLQMHCGGNEKHILLSFTRVMNLDKVFTERLSLFLESVSSKLAPLNNSRIFLDIFEDDQVSFEVKKQLLCVFNEMMKYLLTGHFSQPRDATKITDFETNEEELRFQNVNLILMNFKTLLAIFKNDTNNMKQIVEILTFVKQEWLQCCQTKEQQEAMFSLLKSIFMTTTDKDLLEYIVRIFAAFPEEQFIQEMQIVELSNDLKQLLVKSANENLLKRLKNQTKELSIIFSKFDLTKKIAWTVIFQTWESSYLNIVKYLIVACKWHLVWRLRNFLKNLNNNNCEESTIVLKENFKEFISYCISVLNEGGFLIFETICDLFILWNETLDEAKQQTAFTHLSLDQEKILVDFTVKNLIISRELDLNQRRRLLNDFVNLIYLGEMRVEHLSLILSYCHSHYNDFKPIFHRIFHNLNQQNPAVPLIVMQTLADMYIEVVKEYGVFNIAGTESTNLKRLAKHFVSLKILKSGNNLQKLVTMLINYSFKDKANCAFLYIARYFATELKTDQKRDVYDLFLKMTPKEEKNNNIVLLFSKSLKPKP